MEPFIDKILVSRYSLIGGLVLLFFAITATDLISNDVGGTDHIVERAIYFDQSRSLSIEEIVEKEFSTFQGVMNSHGYSDGKIWLRVTVKPSVNYEPLFLHVHPNNRNLISLYTPDRQQKPGWTVEQTGNRVAWKDRPVKSKDLGFVLNPIQSTTYYISLETLGSASIDLQAHTLTETALNEHKTLIWEMAYFFAFLLVLTWSGYQYYLKKNSINFIFCVAHCLYLALAFCVLGYLDPFVPNSNSISEVVFLLIILTTAATCYFHRELLYERGIPSWCTRAINLAILVSIFSMVLLLSGNERIALRLNSLNILYVIICIFISACLSKSDEYLTKYTIIGHYSFLLISVFTHLLPILGLVEIPALSSNGVLFHGIISVSIFGHLLHEKSVCENNQLQQTITELAVTKREEELERAKLEEKSLFVTMLAHELKNPLASINITADTLGASTPSDTERLSRIRRAVNEIDALIKRCLVSDQIENDNISLEVDRFDVISLCAEIIEQFNNKRIVFVDGTDQEIQLETDRELLRIAIINLIKNALVHSPAGSTVRIVTEEARTHLGFLISNSVRSGVLIDTNVMFHKYSRGENSRQTNGSGLGLYLVAKIAENLGGTVKALSKGDHVTVVLNIPKIT